jgi:hypothetical protein
MIERDGRNKLQFEMFGELKRGEEKRNTKGQSFRVFWPLVGKKSNCWSENDLAGKCTHSFRDVG